MKVFAISLARADARRRHITTHLTERGLDFELIEAVDGRELTDEQIAEVCDLSALKGHETWMTRGAVGCLLSHRRAFQRILEEDLSHAFIVEDDVELQPTIVGILRALELKMTAQEVALLHFVSFYGPPKLSTQGGRQLTSDGFRLLYPTHHVLGSSAAYVVTRDAARGMLRVTERMTFPADGWYPYMRDRAFKMLSAVYPYCCRTLPFRSTLDYVAPTTLVARISSLVEQYHVPVINRLLRWRRERFMRSTAGRIELTDRAPPEGPSNTLV